MDRNLPFVFGDDGCHASNTSDPSRPENIPVMLNPLLDVTGDENRVVATGACDVCSDYLLVCEAKSTTLNQGQWHFTLEMADGSPVFDAGDTERGDLNRLTLLAAVRGLEFIDGAASVTLLSNNRYLVRSLTDSLPRWRESDFVWEHFGQRIDVQHADLWRRIDRAISIHRVEACLISSRLISVPSASGQAERSESESIQRFDGPHRQASAPKMQSAPKDRLRRWLMGGVRDGATTARNRFTPADWMDSA
jgi:ribonuclease HI